jgi:hypothetical protein
MPDPQPTAAEVLAELRAVIAPDDYVSYRVGGATKRAIAVIEAQQRQIERLRLVQRELLAEIDEAAEHEEAVGDAYVADLLRRVRATSAEGAERGGGT